MKVNSTNSVQCMILGLVMTLSTLISQFISNIFYNIVVSKRGISHEHGQVLFKYIFYKHNTLQETEIH